MIILRLSGQGRAKDLLQLGRASIYVKHTAYEGEVLPTRGAPAGSDQQEGAREPAKCQHSGSSLLGSWLYQTVSFPSHENCKCGIRAVHSLPRSVVLANPVLIFLSLRGVSEAGETTQCVRGYRSHRGPRFSSQHCSSSTVIFHVLRYCTNTHTHTHTCTYTH